MKTRVLKSLLTLIFAVMALPVLSQDFMNIYFKDGTTRKFYLRNVTEIITSRQDANGMMHSDYDYQHVTTLYDKYIFALNDVDSISFTKYYEEKAKENISNTMSAIVPLLSSCQTIEDAESKIEFIKGLESVDDSWSDGQDLYVKIKGWETMSFVFPLNNEDDDIPNNDKSRRISSVSRKVLINPDVKERDLYFCIANQFINNELDADIQNEYILPLMEALDQCKRIACFPKSPTIEFFKTEMFKYDVIFLLTHGSYRKGKGGHNIIAADSLGKSENVVFDPTDSEQLEWKNNLDKIRKENGDFTDDDIIIAWVRERRGTGINSIKWYGYPRIFESFFDNQNVGNFSNPNSILFNISCQSIKGDHDDDALTFVEKLKSRGLGVYLGYNEKNHDGYKAGYSLFTSMLNGWSLQKAFDEIPFGYKYDINFQPDFWNTTGSNILMWPCNNTVSFDDLYITPVFTNQINNDEAVSTYNYNRTIMIKGETTSLDPEKVDMGFIYGTDQDLNQYKFAEFIDKTKLSTPSNNGNCIFRGEIKDAEPDNTYYYRAFTYDGLSYNYGNICTFSIPKPEDPSSSDVNLVNNGDLEGTDVSNFFVKINAGDINPAVISNGVGMNGSRGIKVAATARVSETWDNQFWVRLNRPVSAGTKYRFSFNYRADKSADVSTEYHAEPSEYIDWGEYITFTSAWKSYSKEGVITSSQSKTDMPFQSIAFTLNNYADANNYYFDNIKFEVLTDDEETIPDLKLSSTAPITLEVGESRSITITSGSGNYDVISSAPSYVSVQRNGNIITITAHKVGPATITVTDTKSGDVEKISVTVKDSSASGWVSLVNNGDMEASDVSSFFERTGTWEIDYYPATISNGIGRYGSRGIKVEATERVSEEWDNQFWVRLNQPVSEGTKYRFSFDYRADKSAEVRTEYHAEPGDYIEWDRNYVDFASSWQTFKYEGTLSSSYSSDEKPFQSIAFDLSTYSGANNYYFDNIKFEVILDGQCPKPTFKLNGNKLSIQSPFTTRIYYTLNGTTPTTRSSVYTSPLALNQGCTIKAIAVVDASYISPVAAYTYSGEGEEESDGCPAKVVSVELTKTEYHRDDTYPNQMFFTVNAVLKDVTGIEEWGVYFDNRPGILVFPFSSVEYNQSKYLYYNGKEGLMRIDLNAYIAQLDDEVGVYVKKRNKSGELKTIYSSKFKFSLVYDTKPSLILSNPIIQSTVITGYDNGVKNYKTTITHDYTLTGAFWINYIDSDVSGGNWSFNNYNPKWYPEQDGSGELEWIATYSEETHLEHTNWRVVHLRNSKTFNSNYVNFNGSGTLTEAWVSSTPAYRSRQKGGTETGNESKSKNYIILNIPKDLGKGTVIPMQNKKEFQYKGGSLGSYKE